MGASNSKVEEDKTLQLCRERKKFVRQALDGRCSLAAAHVTYIQSLRSTGTALRKFVQPEGQVEPFNTSANATPELLALTENSPSEFPLTSPSVSQRVDAAEQVYPSPSPPTSRQYQTNHMKFRGSSGRKVEEKPPTAVTGTIISASTPQRTTSSSQEGAETSPFDTSTPLSENQPWDYFGLSHPADNHSSSHESRGVADSLENYDDVKKIREDEGILEDEDEKLSSNEREGSEESEDEFDEPSLDTLVRSFENLNRGMSHGATSGSPTTLTTGSGTPEKEFLNGEEINSPMLSPLISKSSEFVHPIETKMTHMKEDGIEHKVAPKDFFLSMRDVENIFIKASEAGIEVPRLLEANKLHFRPILPGRESGSTASTLLKACFSCGEDPSQVQEEPAQTTIKYLTWQRTASSHSSSSRNPLTSNSRDDMEDHHLFENFCMNSGSHASTLDRLYAWERKLYDEVKASQIVRREYDMKCKLLRQQESRGESSQKIDKTRADIKDLHSRIRVAIQRIDSISKRIEELRDKELQPQLEELIEGLCRMWEMMYECHSLQLHIVTIAYSNSNMKISMHSEGHRQTTIHLENELGSLSSSFTKWVSAQKFYVQAINNWLHKCVSINQKSSKRNKRSSPPSLRHLGPPIYMTCGVWLEKLDTLPSKEVVDATKGLAAETSRFLPHQEKSQGKKATEGADPAVQMLNAEAFEDWNSSYDNFRTSLVIFLHQLTNFADCSVKMYGELQKAIEEAKRNYQHWMSQP
ncbi:hypothetical protein Ancab_010730 [Ancistrocladus abbreviatus]